VEAHNMLAARSSDRIAYLSQPEVWEAIRAVYSQYLQLFPDDASIRSGFVHAATQSRRWREAHEQLQMLADKADMNVFGSRESWDYLRRKAERLSAVGD
jgi:hypothetical protein